MSTDSLKNAYLEALKVAKVDVSIYLINGIKLQGKIAAFDDDSILLKNTITQIVLQHAASTVVPASNIDLQSLGIDG